MLSMNLNSRPTRIQSDIPKIPTSSRLLWNMDALDAMTRASRHARHGPFNMAGNLDIVVRELAQLTIVEANVLLLCAHTQRQTGNEVHDEQDDAG